MHSKQEDGYRAAGLTSTTQTNPSFAQREHGDSIISPNNSIAATVRDQWAVEEKAKGLETLEGIISKDINQVN